MLELKPFVGHRMVVPVIKVKANHIGVWEAGLTRVLNNTPFEYFFEDEVLEGIIVCDLSELLVSCMHRAQQKAGDIKVRSGGKKPSIAPIYREILAKELRIPIQYEGRSYFMWYGWGSGAKGEDAKVWGMTRDFMKAMKAPRIAEDGVRATRYLFPDNLYGALVATGLRIKIVKKGTNWNGYVIHDGISGIRRSITDQGYSGQPKIHMGEGRQSWQVWQLFPYEAIKDEIEPIMDDHINNILANETWETSVYKELHQDLYFDADPELRTHPYFVNAFSRQTSRRTAEFATCPPFKADSRIAVPTDLKFLVYEPGHDLLGVRFPVNSPSNCRHFQTLNTWEAQQAWAWLQEQEVLQYGLTSKRFGAKGDMWVIPDELMKDAQGNQWDIILCADDLKMYRMEPGEQKPRDVVYNARTQDHMIVDEPVVIGFQQWWDQGSLVGVPYEFEVETHDTDHTAHEEGSPVYGTSKMIVWKWDKSRKAWNHLVRVWSTFGADYDGDGMQIIYVDGFPHVIEAAQNLRYVESVKFPKDQHPLDDRPQLLINSLVSAIGLASIVMATSFGEGATDAERAKIAEKMHLGTVELLDQWNWIKIQEQTDMLKSMEIDGLKSFDDIIKKSGHQIGRYNGLVPWARFTHSKEAFSSVLPWFRKDMPQDMKEKAADKLNGPRYRRHNEKYRVMIPDAFEASTIGKIYKHNRPLIEKIIWDPDLGNFLLLNVMRSDLSSYLDRFPPVPPLALEKAVSLLERYNQLRRATFTKIDEEALVDDLGDQPVFDSITPVEKDLLDTFKQTWRNDLAKAEASGDFTDHMELVYAVGIASHAVEASIETAGALFDGFPRESLWIFREKPGRDPKYRHDIIQTIITGCEKNFEGGMVPARLEKISVEVKDVNIHQQVKRCIISLDEQTNALMKDNRADGYPLHHMGVVIPITVGHMKTYNVTNPRPGKYLATIVRMSGRASWMVTLYLPTPTVGVTPT